MLLIRFFVYATFFGTYFTFNVAFSQAIISAL